VSDTTAALAASGGRPPLSRALTIASIALYCLVIGWTARSSYRDPVWNLDAILYLSAALSWTEPDPVQRHRRVYDEVARAVPERAFAEMTTTSDYRRALSASPVALETQLRFCRNRPGYVAGVAALHGLGMNGAIATRVVSIAAFAAAAIIVLVWLIGIGAGPLHHLLAALLFGSSPLAEIAGLSDPDMLGTAPFAFAAWLILGKGRTVAGVLVACLAVLSRPDAGFLALALIAWAALFAPGHRLPLKRAAALGAAVLIVSIAIPSLLGGAQVGVFHRFYFESRLYEPARMHETISLAGYWAAFRQNLSGKGLYHPSVMSLHFTITVMAALALVTRRDALARPMLGWWGLIWLYAPAHYVLFPDRSDRYFAPVYLLSALGAIAYAFAPRPVAMADQIPK
jgi:hypothetical protein